MDQNIKAIAAAYMASAEAGERFLKHTNPEDMQENATQFVKADEMFRDLNTDQAPQLLALRHAVAMGNFSSAKTYYAEITK